MRGTVLFLLRAAIGMLIALLGSFFFLLVDNSPSLPDVPFAGIAITAGHQTVHLPNRIFDCNADDQRVQCHTTLQSQTLSLSWQQDRKFPANLSQCRALFAGKSVECIDAGADYIGSKGPLLYYELTGLGLSYAQLQGLRQQYFWNNTLSQFGELRLLQILTGVAIATGLLMAATSWLYPGKLAEVFVSFVIGLGTYTQVWNWFGSIPYDRLSLLNIMPDLWDKLVPALALLAALVTGIITAMLLWGRFRRLARIGPTVISGFGMFCLTLVSLPSLFHNFVPINNLALINSVPIIATGIAAGIGLATAGLLWIYNDRSIRTFISVGSGLGAFGLLSMLFLVSLLELGYAD
jgi:hypothetical protein